MESDGSYNLPRTILTFSLVNICLFLLQVSSFCYSILAPSFKVRFEVKFRPVGSQTILQVCVYKQRQFFLFVSLSTKISRKIRRPILFLAIAFSNDFVSPLKLASAI